MRSFPVIASVSGLQSEGVLLVEDGNHGEYRPRPDEFTSNGVAFIRAADMSDGRVLFESASKINDRARQRITKGIGQPGDVLLSHKGTVGKVALVPCDAPPFVCSPQTTFWRTLDQDVLDRQYLYAFLRSPEFHRQLATRAGETDMAPYVSLTSQRGLQIALPPIVLQRQIGETVGGLDDKIELNRRMNETLEAMARAIFKSWFVDFDPVRAKAEGRQPFGMDAETAALFPDSFEDSPLAKIPKGWRVGSLADVLEITGGGTPKTSVADYWNGEIPWFSVVDAPRQGEVFVITTAKKITTVGLESCSAQLLPIGTTIISARGTVGQLAVVGVPMAMNQSCYALRGKDGRGDYWTYFNMRNLVSELARSTHGTVFDTITRETFGTVKTVIPPTNVAHRFDDFVRGFMGRILTSLEESRTLTAIRDTLLPKLISGEIRLNEYCDNVSKVRI